MSSIKVSIEEFLSLSQEMICPDYSEQAKLNSGFECKIPSLYGDGRIVTAPLIGGAGLVVMEARFPHDIEIYAEQTQQESISFTVCLSGGMESIDAKETLIKVAQNETVFVRYRHKQPRISSRFQAGINHCFVTVYLSTDWLRSAAENLQSEILSDPYWEGVHIPGTASQMMRTLAHDIIAATREPRLQRQFLSARVLDLWSHQVRLLQRLSTQTTQQHRHLKAQDIARIHQAADILVHDMTDPPGLMELSRRIGINDNKLKKDFKQIFGTTVYAYLQQQRLHKAKALISQRECNIMQAAAAVGFNSASHFSTIFKQAYGVSPRELLRTGHVH